MFRSSLLKGLAASVVFLTTSHVWAATSDISVDENPDIGALFPVAGQVITGEADGEQFLSVANEIGESFKAGTNPTFTKVQSSFKEWSYNRGVGTIPNTCQSGYSKAGALCYQHCPQGYDTVAGVCWQRCPEGYSNGGALCTKWKWWPHTIAKHSFLQDIKTMRCPSGKVNEAGLCYTPCAETFNGVGPFCFGSFGGVVDQQRIRDQASQQHTQALNDLAGGGVVLGEGQTPVLKTDLSFTPIVCAIDNTEGAFGLPLPGADGIASSAVDAAVGAIQPGAWFDAALSDVVLLDFSMDATCNDDGVVATGGLSFSPSVTVQASTRMFDSALHNLAGVDLGILSVSVYELIPFRVYGTVGTTLGVTASISSTIDRSQPPVIIDGRQHANSTALDIIPEQNLWLSAEAYLRITSIFSFIPDLVQLGAEFRLFILELALPYNLEEGVSENDAGQPEVFKRESLVGELTAGRGYIDTFLRILGIETGIFGDNADVDWDGYNTHEVYLNTDESEPVQPL